MLHVAACPDLPVIENGEWECEPDDDINGQVHCSVECDELHGYFLDEDGVGDIVCGPDTGPDSGENFFWFNALDIEEQVDVSNTDRFAGCNGNNTFFYLE